MGGRTPQPHDFVLYRIEHDTFEDYCREKWGMSKTHCNRLISCAEATSNLTPVGVIPSSERRCDAYKSEIRGLFLEPEKQREAWSKAVEESGGSPTAKGVEKAVQDVIESDRPKNAIRWGMLEIWPLFLPVTLL